MTNIDPYFYIFDSVGFPDNCYTIDIPENFRVYLLCDTLDRRQIFVHTDREEFNLSNARYDTDVNRLFISLSTKLPECEIATDIFEYYTESDLHKAHKTKIGNTFEPVYRLRKNKLRVYLVFVGSDIVLFRLSTKDQDKISKSEAKKLDDRVKAIFKYSYDNKEFLRRLL